jgi:hypothetical protein
MSQGIGELGGTKYIFNKQVGGDCSLMKNETFKVISRKGYIRKGGGGMNGKRWW